MKVSAIKIFTFVVAMGLSLCVMAQNTNQENPKRITNTNDGDSDAFKVYFSVKQDNGEIVYKKLGIEDNKTFIIDINGKKYTAFIDEILGGVGLYHNKKRVDAIEASRQDVVLLLKVARNTGDEHELSAQDIKSLPEGTWGKYNVKTENVASGWVQKIITNDEIGQVILTVEDKQ